MTSTPRVSIVVNTLDRAESLARTLASFRQLTYPEFEVVVVDGPSSDDTEQVISSFGDDLKHLRCPEANLSMSRNIGIAAASGEIVAFIDDDGIPEPSWLEQLVEMYDSPEVAGAGGVVHDHTGYTFQCRFNSSDRFGNASFDAHGPLDDWCFPGTSRFPYLVGTNASFRRDALIEVGGFDEEIEYYLDETDVCLRLVDAGYVLRQSPAAAVHHKFLPSDVRSSNRVTTNNFPIVKNRIYFAMVNREEGTRLALALGDAARFAEERAADLQHHVELGNLDPAALGPALDQIERAWPVGLEAGFRGRTTMLSHDLLERHSSPFVRFGVTRPSGRRLRLCFVTQSLPPTDVGGIGRYMLDLARGLAAEGHEIHIVTTGVGHSTVDLEHGVWVHRVLKDADPGSLGSRADLPPRIAANAAAVVDEVVRIGGRTPFDAVYAAMWDTETIGVLERTSLPVVTALVTTMGISLRTRPEWREDPVFMRELGTPLLELERRLLQESDLLHAISEAVIRDVSATSGVDLEPARTVVAPLGVPDHRVVAGAEQPHSDPLQVLFVGRFEKRKGIDLLLGCLPEVLEANPGVRVVLIGRDTLPGEHGEPYRARFERQHAGAPWMSRVEFRGEVDDDELRAAYAAADVFVAPSRFESFGLIFVEAMVNGLPVVALAAGAATEVVEDGVTGVLVAEPEPAALAAALQDLLGDPARARKMGTAGRERYERGYSAAAMVEGARRLFCRIATRRPGDAGFPSRADEGRVTALPDGFDGLELSPDEPVTCDIPDGVGHAVAVLWCSGSPAASAELVTDERVERVRVPRAAGFVRVPLSGARHVEMTGVDVCLAALVTVT